MPVAIVHRLQQLVRSSRMKLFEGLSGQNFVLSCTDVVRALSEKPFVFLGKHYVRSSSLCCVLLQ